MISLHSRTGGPAELTVPNGRPAFSAQIVGKSSCAADGWDVGLVATAKRFSPTDLMFTGPAGKVSNAAYRPTASC